MPPLAPMRPAPTFRGLAAAVLAVLLAAAPSAQTVTRAEYFVDADPGLGLATPITLTPGGTADASFTVATVGLAEGLHTLHVRVRRSNGRWSVPRQQPFRVDAVRPPSPDALTAAEYFVDVDPGVGQATPLALATGGVGTVDVPTAGLAVGLHTLHVRSRRSNGRWSPAQARPFRVEAVRDDTPEPIVAVEYFVDADPGVGAGTRIPVSAGPLVSVEASVALGGLAEGSHVVSVRARDAAGVWSAPVRRTFVYGTMPAVVLSAPADNATSVSTTPTLAWGEAGGADAYHLRLALASTPTAFLVNDSTLAATAYTPAALTPLTAHVWQVRARAAGVWGAWSVLRRFTTGTGVADEETETGLPAAFALHAPFPNPLTGAAVLPLDVPAPSRVRLSVYDVQGRRVAVAVDEEMAAGAHRIRWSADGLASGVYVVRMEAGAFVAVRRIVVVR